VLTILLLLLGGLLALLLLILIAGVVLLTAVFAVVVRQWLSSIGRPLREKPTPCRSPRMFRAPSTK